MTTHYVTSESVTEGHPDKLCDQISDAILDACLAQDPRSHVAVETMASKNTVMIAGEITTKARIDAEAIARGVMREIGYTSQEAGIDADRCLVLTNLNVQSADIAMGVNRSADGMEVIGGGDQGIMYGYAVRETDHLMPKTIELAHGLVRRLAEVRKDGSVPGLYPDGKAQVTMSYAEDGTPVSVESVVVSAQHEAGVSPPELRDALIRKVILPVIPEAELLPPEKIFINPTGRFVIGGPTRGSPGGRLWSIPTAASENTAAAPSPGRIRARLTGQPRTWPDTPQRTLWRRDWPNGVRSPSLM